MSALLTFAGGVAARFSPYVPRALRPARFAYCVYYRGYEPGFQGKSGGIQMFQGCQIGQTAQKQSRKGPAETTQTRYF